MEKTFIQTSVKLLDLVISHCPDASAINQILTIGDSGMDTAMGNMLSFFAYAKSLLPDEPVNEKKLDSVLQALSETQSLIRLNHIGFCYKVPSQSAEKERLLEIAQRVNIHIWQEESIDAGLWLFFGNGSKWDDPVIELLPVEHTSDKFSPYWLPHMQIDLDTSLEGGEISEILNRIYGNKAYPYPINIKGVTYIIRKRLGILNGINIHLDIATNKRNVQLQRSDIWKRLV